MPTGTWRRRRLLPSTPGTEHVVPIGEASAAEVEEYRRGREDERVKIEHGATDR